MTNTITHFEIYGEHPVALADFYRKAFGWQVEQMPGIGYWRVQTGATEGPALHGGLTHRAIPDLNGWMLFVNVPSLNEAVAHIQHLGGSIVRPKTAVPKTAWVRPRHEGGTPCRPERAHPSRWRKPRRQV